MVEETADHLTQAGEMVDQPKAVRFAFKRAQRRRLQRIVAKGIQAQAARKKSQPRTQPKYNRATRRAMQRASRKLIRQAQHQVLALCPRCQMPSLGPANFRCGCKVERQPARL